MLYRTTNGGTTWKPGAALPGPTNYFEIEPGSFSIPDTRHALLLVRSALYRTDDMGTHWYVVNHHLPLPSGHVQVQFLNASVGFAILAYDAQAHGRSYLLRTRDGGRNWSRVQTAEQR